MKPILYDAAETDFTSNGLGRLNPIRCLVTEERNGQYELEMDISMDDRHFADIAEGRIIFAYHDDTKIGQPFEIYQISRPIDGTVTVNAWHISYRTMKMTVMPFEARSCSAAMGLLATNVIGTCPFSFHTDMTTAADISFNRPTALRNVLGGSEGSMLDTYGGEFEWDKWNIYLRSVRGTQTDVVLRYGKNITDLKKVTDMTNIWTGICPYWAGQDENGTEVLVTLSEKAVYAGNAGNYAYRMTIPVDLTGSFEGKPTEAQLREKAQQYVSQNAVSGIPATIDVSFVQLWQTQEYENVAALERLKLCDTLTIRYEKLGVQNTAKIVKTVYDVLLERYESMTVGDIRTTLGDTIIAAAEEVKKTAITKTAMQRAIEAATALIRGGLGGHVVFNTDTDGHPNEILIMDTDSTATAVNVLRINMNGIGFSSSGYNGPFHSAWTLDGAFVADYITAGTLNAAIIKAGVLSDEAGTNFWDMVTGEFRLASTATVGGKTVSTIASEAVDGYDTRLTQQVVFNKLTNNGQTQGIYLNNGLLYINGAYIATGIITDRAGSNYWNMDTGEFRLAATTKVGSGNDTVATASDVNSAVVATDVEYGNSNSSGTTPSTWTTNANWTQGKYLWTRTKMTLKSGTVQYSAARMIANGSGLGLSEVTEQYYLSTSNLSQAGGSWQDTQPAWVDGRYYWTRSRIDWADGTTTYTTPVLAAALTSGNQSTTDLDTSLNQQKIFNRLTNNGQTQGIYLNNGLLYINATYIATGTLADAGNNVMFDLTTGTLTMKKGSINIGNGQFAVDTSGNLTANNASIKGTIMGGSENSYWMRLTTNGTLTAGYMNDQRGLIAPNSTAAIEDGGVITAVYGMRVVSGMLWIGTPHIMIADSASDNAAATLCGSGTMNFISKIENNPNGGITWYNSSVRFVNGLMVTQLVSS